MGGQVAHPFRAAVEARDIDAAVVLVSDDVVFRSPVVFEPYQGREAVAPILRAAFQVFEDFRCVREIGSEDAADHAFVFHAHVGDQQIEGIDLLHIDDRGSIDELVVMVRPLTATLALAKAVEAQVAAAESSVRMTLALAKAMKAQPTAAEQRPRVRMPCTRQATPEGTQPPKALSSTR